MYVPRYGCCELQKRMPCPEHVQSSDEPIFELKFFDEKLQNFVDKICLLFGYRVQYIVDEFTLPINDIMSIRDRKTWTATFHPKFRWQQQINAYFSHT